MKLEDVPQEAVDAVEVILGKFGYRVSGDCSVHVAHAALTSVLETPQSSDNSHGRDNFPGLDTYVLMWLGYWRDKMPPEAVRQLQDFVRLSGT